MRSVLLPLVKPPASGVAFVLRIAPLQKQLLALATAAATGAPWDQPRYHRLSRQWEWWGLFAIVTPLAALALMVVKPGH